MVVLPMARRGRVQLIRWMMAMCALVLALAVMPAHAADPQRVDSVPEVGTFKTARFDILTTIKVQDLSQVFYGEGQVVNPDRVALWLGTDGTDQLIYTVQIGTVFYSNDGSGWEKSEGAPADGGMVPVMQPVSMNDSLNQLEEIASGILWMGEADVRGMKANQYQVWISGIEAFDEELTEQLPEEARELLRGMVLKLDLWIGPDSLIHQQNIVVTLPPTGDGDDAFPGLEYTTLITYYDINDPNIAVNPPI